MFPAEVVDAKTSHEESPVAVRASFSVGTPSIFSEPHVYMSTTFLVSIEVSAFPAEVVDAKTSVEESPVAVYV